MAKDPDVVPAVFADREQAEAAIAELTEAGLGDDIGVAVPDPGRYLVVDDREKAELAGITRGIAAGAPLGTLAGIAISAVTVAGGGVLGVGGLLLGAVGGAAWGTFFGAFAGFTAKVRLDDYEDRWCEIPLGHEDLLVAARVGKDRARRAREIMEKHGARCFMDAVREED